MLSYRGGRKDCIWVKGNMLVLVMQRLVEEVIGEALQERGICYTMKYDRREPLHFRKDVDVMKLLKGHDEHAYIYVGGEGAVLQ